MVRVAAHVAVSVLFFYLQKLQEQQSRECFGYRAWYVHKPSCFCRAETYTYKVHSYFAISCTRSLDPCPPRSFYWGRFLYQKKRKSSASFLDQADTNTLEYLQLRCAVYLYPNDPSRRICCPPTRPPECLIRVVLRTVTCFDKALFLLVVESFLFVSFGRSISPGTATRLRPGTRSRAG